MAQKQLLGVCALAILALLIAVLALQRPAAAPANPMSDAIVAEYFRLENLSESRNLTQSDLATIKGLSAHNPRLAGELSEAEWFIAHNSTHHALHSIESIAIIVTEGEWNCPADSLAHVGLFLAYNETGLATDSLKEGEEGLAQWEAQARAVKARSAQAYPNLDAVVAAMRAEIEAFHANDTATVAREAAYLSDNGYC